MTAWRYEISLRVLKKYFTSERSKRVKYFSTLEEKFRISARPCNILYLFNFLTNSLNQWLLILLDLLWPNFYSNQIQFLLEVKKDRYSTVVVYITLL